MVRRFKPPNMQADADKNKQEQSATMKQVLRENAEKVQKRQIRPRRVRNSQYQANN